MHYQVQEMLRAERIFRGAGTEDELNTYNPLIPDGSNWKATFMIEYGDEDERRIALGKMIGIEHKVWVQVAGCASPADCRRRSGTHDRGKTSSVHFLRFEFTPEMIRAVKGGADIGIGIDHPEYRYQVEKLPQKRYATRSPPISRKRRYQARGTRREGKRRGAGRALPSSHASRTSPLILVYCAPMQQRGGKIPSKRDLPQPLLVSWSLQPSYYFSPRPGFPPEELLNVRSLRRLWKIRRKKQGRAMDGTGGRPAGISVRPEPDRRAHAGDLHPQRSISTKNRISLAEDGIARFTLVIESISGSRNVFFEGITAGRASTRPTLVERRIRPSSRSKTEVGTGCRITTPMPFAFS